MDIRPQPGPQSAFLSSPADIVIYGGAAGGGKSYGLVIEPLRHVGNKGFGGVIFRRVTKELVGPGSLWELAGQMYPLLGATLRENPYIVATFPSGAALEFSHLQHAQDVLAHHGKQYAFVGFDELQRFEESQFWYLLSRMRTTCGIRPYMRATCNPDPDSFVRKLIDWWIDKDGNPIEERSGVLRWFIRRGGELYWADTAEELIEEFGECEPLSLTFIGAKLDDNRKLTQADPGYRAKLEALPEIERARLLGGNWNVRASGGKYVPATCFMKRWVKDPKDADPENDILALPQRLNVYMTSDFAVTEPEGPDDDPDFTEHGVFGLCEQGFAWVLDWWYGQTTSDVWIESLLDMWVKWKPFCWFGEGGVIRRAIEPGLKRRMKARRVYCRVEWLNPTGRSVAQGTSKEGYADRSKQAKAIRGRPFQAMAHQGLWVFPANAPWAGRVISHIVNFPAKGPDDAFDVVTLLSTAIDIHHPAVSTIVDTSENHEDYSSRGRQQGKSWRTRL